MFKNTALMFSVLVLMLGCVASSPGTDSGTVEIQIAHENQKKTIMYDLSDNDVDNIRIDFTDGPSENDSITFN